MARVAAFRPSLGVTLPSGPRIAFAVGSERPLVVAHRGASREAQDYSLAAVERAIEPGVDMVEIDVRRTADGILIAHHDAQVEGRPISNLSYADLTDLLGHVPATIDGIVRLAAGRTALDIELKEDGYEPEVFDLLDRHVSAGDVIITSFLEPAVVAAKQWGHRAGLLREASSRSRDIFAALDRCGADVLAPHISLADGSLLAAAAARQVPVMVWTVNESGELKRCLADPRIAAVITDLPGVAVALRTAVAAVRDGRRAQGAP